MSRSSRSSASAAARFAASSNTTSGPKASSASVVVVSTSDSPPLVRLRAAFAATGDRGVLPRPGQARAADDGLGDPLRDGAARSRSGRGRAADGEGLSAVGVRAAAGTARARGELRGRAAASRRSTPCSSKATTRRADRRLGSRHPGRPHRAVARAWRAQSLSGHRHSLQRQPDDARRDAGRSSTEGRAGARLARRRCETAKISSASAPTSPAAIRASTRRWRSATQIDAFLKQPADVACSLDESIAALRAI